MDKLRDGLATKLAQPINTSLIMILGVYTILWGLWIFSPFWTVFTQAPLFDAMNHLMPEPLWGVTAMLAGIFTVKGSSGKDYNKLIIGSMISFLHWFLIGLLYFIGDWQNTGGLTAMMLAVYSAIVWLNIKINRKQFKTR